MLTAAAIGDHHLIARFFTFTRFQDLLHDPLADRLTFIFSLTGEGRQRQRHAQQAEGFLYMSCSQIILIRGQRNPLLAALL